VKCISPVNELCYTLNNYHLLTSSKKPYKATVVIFW